MTLHAELSSQRVAIEGRVPVYGRLLAELAALRGTAEWERIEQAWASRKFFAPYARPLLLLAALRFDSLSEGPVHPLWHAISDDSTSPERVDRDALVSALAPGRERFWNALRSRVVQTNETSRAIAWLWPASFVSHPVALVDLGASAGLNLIADSLPWIWTDSHDRPMPTGGKRPEIVRRLGLDASPIDVTDADSALWLRACVWPGETERLERLDISISTFRAAAGGLAEPELESCLARSMPERLDSLCMELDSDVFVLAYQFVVRDYLEPVEREAFESGMRDWLRSRPTRSLWVELEHASDGTPELPSVIVAHAAGLAGAMDSVTLGRCGYHPRRLKVDREGVERFATLLGPRSPE